VKRRLHQILAPPRTVARGRIRLEQCMPMQAGHETGSAFACWHVQNLLTCVGRRTYVHSWKHDDACRRLISACCICLYFFSSLIDWTSIFIFRVIRDKSFWRQARRQLWIELALSMSSQEKFGAYWPRALCRRHGVASGHCRPRTENKASFRNDPSDRIGPRLALL